MTDIVVSRPLDSFRIVAAARNSLREVERAARKPLAKKHVLCDDSSYKSVALVMRSTLRTYSRSKKMLSGGRV